MVLATAGVGVACTVLLGVGIPLVAPLLAVVQNRADAARRRLGLPRNPRPAVTETGWAAGTAACRRVFHDPATRRDLAWAGGGWPAGLTLGLIPALSLAGGLWGLASPLSWRWAAQAWNGSWYLFVPLVSPATAGMAAVLGAVMIAAGLRAAPLLGRAADRYAARLLGASTVARLTERVEHLAATRSETLDAQQSEIRRIERDLHDGAQARLMAMGMTLKLAEKTLRQDPDAAFTLLEQAQEDSRRAMQELRDLVHGIHPPVLADRGLVDAVRALTLECRIPTTVTSTLTGRLASPLESALYFSVGELLTNVVKHAGASHATVTLTSTTSAITVVVADDGRGGADPHRGTGITGVRRRLAAFDGTLSVDSPPGGPTVVTIGLPLI
ncbi:histidine kinase [Actinoplanes sp. NBRC 101535]|nr:histidine kinase [Actinoplanes sp. NBRC 101535]